MFSNPEVTVITLCGICFFQFTPDSCINARALMRTLLESVEERGREATGYAYFDAEGVINTNNAPLAASEFTKSRREFRMDAAARTGIGHTRLATKGTIANPLNNHPVNAYTPEGKQVAAVHNGGVWNDDEIFETYQLTRYGQVDSEIIAACLAAYGSDAFRGIFGELTGGIATAWLDERSPSTLHAVRAWDSPMVIASIDLTDRLGLKIKGLVGASTVKALTAALGTLGLDWSMEGVKQYEIGEGEYLSVTDGEWDGLIYPFTLPDMTSRWGGSWRKGNSRTQGYTGGYYGTGWDSLDEEVEAAAACYGKFDSGCTSPLNPDCTCKLCVEAMEWESPRGNSHGIGSGKVESGKPSTYMSSPGGVLTPYSDSEDSGVPMALDDEIGAAARAIEDGLMANQEHALPDESWWSAAVRAGEIATLADRLGDPTYSPDAVEMRLIAGATIEETSRLGVTKAMKQRWNADYLWHMEVCEADSCRFDNPVCPASISDSSDPSALAQAAAVWGFAAIAE